MSVGGHSMSETAHIQNMSGAVLIQCRMVIFGSLHYKTTVSGIYAKYVSRGTRWHKKRDGRYVEREKREVEIQ